MLLVEQELQRVDHDVQHQARVVQRLRPEHLGDQVGNHVHAAGVHLHEPVRLDDRHKREPYRRCFVALQLLRGVQRAWQVDHALQELRDHCRPQLKDVADEAAHRHRERRPRHLDVAVFDVGVEVQAQAGAVLGAADEASELEEVLQPHRRAGRGAFGRHRERLLEHGGELLAGQRQHCVEEQRIPV
ncbi:pre-mRNA-processing factor 39-like isoform X3 [Babesia caballi]|uniref:Pre-mRNA-processing factor 39-like isoform X3 n=1 Tax=Babesia caballi TaxID=5871 RepID=A0AAV4LZG4_BABCB|nr:pre-mRNA-processing factor 39-like isoform X3 [Babesia caballi]